MNKLNIINFVGEDKDDEQQLAIIEKLSTGQGPGILITPQEYFGGSYKHESKPYWEEKELRPALEKISRDNNVGIVAGVVEKEDGKLWQRLWFIDGELKGKVSKFATTSYETEWYGLSTEEDMQNRWKTFELKGINVAGFFCWEVFSDLLFAGLGILEPDLVASCIKFGIAAYPKLAPNKSIEKIEKCSGDIWYERLQHISKFETKCPIACSANSWGQNAKTQPLCGILYPYENMKPNPYTSGQVEITQVDFDKVRGNREHKFSYLKRVGEFPGYDQMEYTMLMKIHRIEQRMMGKTADELRFETFKKMRFQRKRRT